MVHSMSDAPNLAPDAFRGTADYYARYRPPYPSAMLDGLMRQVEGRSRLLDLACGPGRICLALSSLFDDVWAIDLEPEMIATGRRLAEQRGIRNVHWFTGRAEDLDGPPGTFDLITIGEAFHRLDQRRVAALALGWLRPGGCVATMGAPSLLGGREPWQQALASVARAFMPAGWASAAPGASTSVMDGEKVLRDAGFAKIASHDYVEPQVWSIEAILGYLRSTSVCSAQVLGDKTTVFDARITEALLALDPAGVYRERLAFGYTLGRKPARPENRFAS